MIEFKAARGNQETLLKIKNLGKLTEKGIHDAWYDIGDDMMKEARSQILKKPKSGRTYFRKIAGGRRRRHIASAPGETHANMTGKLRRSIGWKVRGAFQMEFGYGVDNQAPEYAEFVEMGTSRMKARPSLQNAIRDKIRNAQNHFDRQIAKAMK